MMIKMADRDGKGGVNLEDYVALMKEYNLITDEKKKN